LQVRHWWDYQAPSWAQESKYPAPATWTDRIKVQKGGGNVYILNWSEQGGLPIGIGKAIGKGLPMPIPKPLPMGIEKNKNKIKNKDKDKIVVDRWECSNFPDAYSKFEENIAKITEKNESVIRNWINIVGEETFIEAIKVAVLSNKKSLSYISGVLKNWNKEGKI
jgi:DnaD/phage-associated family protein